MKLVALLIGLSMLIAGNAFGKAEFKKALGNVKCDDCHVPGKFKEKTDKPLYVAAVRMIESTKKGEGEYKGKSCNDCHQGQLKPKH